MGSRSLSIHRSIKSLFISLLSFFFSPYTFIPLFPFYILFFFSFSFSLKSSPPPPLLSFLLFSCHGIFGQSRGQQECRQTDPRRTERLVGNLVENIRFEQTILLLRETKHVFEERKKEPWYLFSNRFIDTRPLQPCNTKINYGEPEKKKKSIDLSSVGRMGVGNPLSVRSTFVH